MIPFYFCFPDLLQLPGLGLKSEKGGNLETGEPLFLRETSRISSADWRELGLTGGVLSVAAGIFPLAGRDWWVGGPALLLTVPTKILYPGPFGNAAKPSLVAGNCA